jgi:hypothetical protein
MNIKQIALLAVCVICAVLVAVVAMWKPDAGEGTHEPLPTIFVSRPTDAGQAEVPGEQRTDAEEPTAAPSDGSAEFIAKLREEFSMYDYDKVIADIDARPDLAGEETEALRAQAEEQKSRLVKYDGKLYHMFFHSLIIYPELAFNGNPNEETYYNYMATVREFQRMLPILRDAGFVLFDYDYILSFDGEGNATYKDIYLPEGKKPLLLSLDDQNYYRYMKGAGFADCLAINGQGDIVTKVITPEGNVEYTYDGDVIPIINEYVKEHPDFSYRGSKGIVGVTGFEGVYGYNYLEMEGEEKAAAIETCRGISEKLKADGWKIASHSYSHKASFADNSIPLNELIADTDQWLDEVGSIVGPTDIYLTPFGSYFTDERRQAWVDRGFRIICPVYYIQDYYEGSKFMIHNRCNIDGITMVIHPERVADFFDPAQVVDERRPKR